MGTISEIFYKVIIYVTKVGPASSLNTPREKVYASGLGMSVLTPKPT